MFFFEEPDYNKLLSYQELGEAGTIDVGSSFLDTFIYEDLSVSKTRNLDHEKMQDVIRAQRVAPELFLQGYEEPELLEGEGYAIDIINQTRKETYQAQTDRQLSDYEGIVEPNIEMLKKLDPEIRNINEIDQAIIDKAKALREKYEQTAARATPWDAFWGTLGGGVVGAMNDPLNVSTMFIGPGATSFSGGFLRGVAAAFGKSAAVNIGVESVIQPAVFDYKKEIESPYELRDALMNIGFAGIGGGILGGAGYSILRGFNKLSARGELTPAQQRVGDYIQQIQNIADNTDVYTARQLEAHVEALVRIDADLKEGRIPDFEQLNNRIEKIYLEDFGKEINGTQADIVELSAKRQELAQRFRSDVYELQSELKQKFEGRMRPDEVEDAQSLSGSAYIRNKPGISLDAVRGAQKADWEAGEAGTKLKAHDDAVQAHIGFKESRKANGDQVKLKERIDKMDAQLDAKTKYLNAAKKAREVYLKKQAEKARKAIPDAPTDNVKQKAFKQLVNRMLANMGATNIKVKVFNGSLPNKLKASKSKSVMPDDARPAEREGYVVVYDATGKPYSARIIDVSENGTMIIENQAGKEVILGQDLSAIEVNVKDPDYQVNANGNKANGETISTLSDAQLEELIGFEKELVGSGGNRALNAVMNINAAKLELKRRSNASNDGVRFSREGDADVAKDSVLQFKPFKVAQDLAKAYTKSKGIKYTPPTKHVVANPERGALIADEFERMEHAPNDPEVAAAYDAMINETIDQFKAILTTDLKIEFIRGDDPYVNGPSDVINDVKNNNHIWVYSTRDGFGSNDKFDPQDNPLLRETEFEIDGVKLLANDVFRIVHDYFGHIKTGTTFRATGEENAWQSHASMYTPLARRAMTTETRGQNSWLNFGPYGKINRTATTKDTIFADQKIGLLPRWVSEENRISADERKARYERDRRNNQTGFEGAIDSSGRVELVHYSRNAISRNDPKRWGQGLSGRVRSEQNRKLSGAIGRTYFGIEQATENGYKAELGLGSYRQTTTVDGELIYNPAKDPENLWDGADIISSEKAIADAGYVGYYVNSQQIGKVVAVFDELELEQTASAARMSKSQSTTYAAIDPETGELHLNIDAFESDEQLMRVLREEVIGHYGLRQTLGSKFNTVISDIKSAAYHNKELRQTWIDLSGVDPRTKQVINENAPYAGMADDVIADEMISKLAREELSFSETTLVKLMSFITKALRAVGLVKNPITMSEMQALVVRSERQLKRGAVQNNTPIRVTGFDSRNDTAADQPLEEIVESEANATVKGEDDGSEIIDTQGNRVNYYESLKDSQRQLDAIDTLRICAL